MPKRSRKQRKTARVRSERARERGLPEPELLSEASAPARRSARRSDVAESEAGSSKRGLPTAAKVAIVLLVALLVLWGLSFLRQT